MVVAIYAGESPKGGDNAHAAEHTHHAACGGVAALDETAATRKSATTGRPHSAQPQARGGGAHTAHRGQPHRRVACPA
eukprot:2987668-Prymnesium_polylepis.1